MCAKIYQLKVKTQIFIQSEESSDATTRPLCLICVKRSKLGNVKVSTLSSLVVPEVVVMTISGAASNDKVGIMTSTEMEMLSFWWNFYHWQHWKLSKWQLPLLPVIKISSKWRHFCLSVSRFPVKYSSSSPPNTWCNDTVIITSKWRRDVVLT